MDARIAVLASGSGTNLQALLGDPRVGPSVVLVLSDRPDAGALERARGHHVKAVTVPPDHYASREDHDRAVLGVLRDEAVEFVLLAGYMRILGSDVVRAFPNRILNIHPSLLPAFPGGHAPRDALDWGAKVTGCTVHLVDEEVDHGPIVLQEAVPILPDDTEDALHERIKQVERRLFPETIRRFLDGDLTS